MYNNSSYAVVKKHITFSSFDFIMGHLNLTANEAEDI